MELYEIALSAPVFPATVLLCVMLSWAVMVILGAIDFHHVIHLPDHADIHVPDAGLSDALTPDSLTPDAVTPDAVAPDAGLHATGMSGTGLHDASGPAGGGVHATFTEGKTAFSSLALRWLNLSGLPVIIWLCVFSVIWWTLSALLWTLVDKHFSPQNSLIWATLLTGRNLILGGLATKVVTQPIHTRFNFTSQSTVTKNLIGKECVISSTEATPDFGLVKFPTGGAPLLLNVRTDGPHLPRGTPVWITHYDAVRRVYVVSPTTTKNIL